MTADEETAQEALRQALKTLQRARELCERVGYGSLVNDALATAVGETQYALDTALGRN